MAVVSRCPGCGAAVTTAEADGAEFRCGRCGSEFVIEEPATTDRPRPRSSPENDSRRAVSALVFGLISAATWPCPPAGLIAGGLALIAGVSSLAARQRQLAVVGIVLGLSGVVFSLGCGVLYGIAIDQEEQVNEPDGNRPPFTH